MKLSKFKLVKIILLSLLIVFPCSSAADDSANNKSVSKTNSIERIVAIVNDDVITLLELESELDLIRQQIRMQRGAIPPENVLRKQVLDRLILLKIQLQMAQQRHIRVNDEALNRTLEGMARNNNISLDQFRMALEREGMVFSEYREKIRNEMVVNRLQQRQVYRRINVTDKEIEDFLANQDLRDRSNEEYRLQHILIVIPEAANAQQIQEAKQKANTVVDKLKSGENFSDLSIAYSEGQKALDGGDLGWRKLAEIPTLFADEVTSMKKNDISDAIRSPSGFHIIKLTDKRSDEKQFIIEQSKVRHILLANNELVSDDELRIRLGKLKQRIESGESFAEIATANSEDKASAVNGGDLGWVSPGMMVKEFEEEMNRLPLDAVSNPIQTKFGWHILQVTERRQHDSTEEYQKKNARDFIRQRKIGPALENWMRQIRDEAFVQVRT